MDQDTTPERPVPPLELVPQLHCPLMAAVGADDTNPSPQLADVLRERLDATGQETRVTVYHGAGHAFFNDTRPNFSPRAAAQLWEDMVPFLARHLHG
jgi:carboxymethylenebutenolidase